MGAGSVGRVVAHQCAQHRDVYEKVLLASRTESKCKAIAEDVWKRHGFKVDTCRLDADDSVAVRRVLADIGADILIHVALPYHNLSLMDACVAAGVHYIDTASYESRDCAHFAYAPQWKYQKAFEKANRMAILGCGFDPGVTNIFVSHAVAHHFDILHTLDITDCNAGTHAHPFATNFNAEINIREITQKGRYYKDKKWHSCAAHTLFRDISYPGIGTKRSYLIYHEELESLVKHFPTLRHARFWMTFSARYLDYLRVIMDIGMGSIEPVRYGGTDIVPLSFLAHILPQGDFLAKDYQGSTSIGCRMSGMYEGKRRGYMIWNHCFHEQAYSQTGSQAVGYTTGVPVELGARLLLEGAWGGRAGVYNVEQLPCAPFMDALAQSGLPWQERIWDGVAQGGLDALMGMEAEVYEERK